MRVCTVAFNQLSLNCLVKCSCVIYFSRILNISIIFFTNMKSQRKRQKFHKAVRSYMYMISVFFNSVIISNKKYTKSIFSIMCLFSFSSIKIQVKLREIMLIAATLTDFPHIIIFQTSQTAHKMTCWFSDKHIMGQFCVVVQ